MEKGKTFSCVKTLREVRYELPENFIQISRNCIVNIDKVTGLNGQIRTVELTDGTKLPVSRRKMKPLRSLYMKRKKKIPG